MKRFPLYTYFISTFDSINRGVKTAPNAKKTIKSKTFYLSDFINQSLRSIVALLSLLFIWIFYRSYQNLRILTELKLSNEDLGLLKIINANSSMLWKKFNPYRNGIFIDDH